MNYLIPFIKENANWKELLSNPPYSLMIKEDPDLPDVYLFKYTQAVSDMNNVICQEARGIILEIKDDVKLLCHSFDKFFNYGEPQGQKVLEKFNWNSYSFQEKRDGSLMRLWYYKGHWRLSTSGTIDAYKAMIEIPSCPYVSFGDMFIVTYAYTEMSSHETVEDSFMKLNKNYTYSFEMTSPDNKIVVDYDKNELTLIGVRNILNNKELDPMIVNPFDNIKTPNVYPFHSMEEAINEINKMSNFEGLVLCDINYDRVKIKTEEYLALAKISELMKSDRSILKLILEGKIDDIKSTLTPHVLNRVNIVETYVKDELKGITSTLATADYTLDKKDFALRYKDNPYASHLFKKYKSPVYNPSDYFNIDNLEKIYKSYRNKMENESN